MLTQLASLGAWDWFIAGGLLLVLEASRHFAEPYATLSVFRGTVHRRVK